MAENSKIEWTHHTFNPWYGCTKISPACDSCYAEGWAKRSGLVKWGAGEARRRSSAKNWKLPLKWNAEAERLGIRYRVFCASLADVFDNAVPEEWRLDLFELIQRTPNLDWLLLTKRIGNAKAMIDALGPEIYLRECGYSGLPDNVWIGATICNQEEADRDIPKLLQIQTKVRFVSMEPLLGPVDLRSVGAFLPRIQMPDWVIVGGESGPNARPMHPDWARGLREQCAAAGVPMLFKQWGEWADVNDWPSETQEDYDVRGKTEGMSIRVGVRLAGRLLDGIKHDGYPK